MIVILLCFNYSYINTSSGLTRLMIVILKIFRILMIY